ncbi:MAG: hypothetical protein R3A10_04340 [Caldilineaceae bacterium]
MLPALCSSTHSPALSLTAAGSARNSLMRSAGNGPVHGGTAGVAGAAGVGVAVGTRMAVVGVGVTGT